MRIEPEMMKCICDEVSCPVHSKCCFLPTESNPGIDGKISLIFVGQGGGATERKLNRPFIGRAGKRLRQQVLYVRKKLKKHIGVAFSNTIRDNPDGNRVPTKEEYDFCLKHLYSDISVLKEKGLCVIIPLGNASKSVFLPKTGSMASCHGELYSFMTDKIGHIKVMPTYHPSYVIRNVPNFSEEKLSDIDKMVTDDIIKAYKFAEEYYQTGVMENDLIMF